MIDPAPLPARRARLNAFVRLKMQRTVLLGAVALLVPASAALALGYADDASLPEPVLTGSSVADVVGEQEMAMSNVAVPGDGTADNGDIATEPADRPRVKFLGGGEASYYGRRFAGKRTASGERFSPRHLTAAHRTLAFGSRVRVTNKRNGKSVIVRINDRGPFHRARIIDLSNEAARRIGLLARGRGQVELALLLD